MTYDEAPRRADKRSYNYFEDNAVGVDIQAQLAHARDRAALARWCALPITYGNDPRSVVDRRGFRVNLRDRAAVRTLGGVADYSSREAA